jgi:hypothetical protein
MSDELKLISLMRFRISPGVLGHLIARSDYMNDHHVSAVTVIDEWEDCRVAGIPTIPIVLTVDFDRLEQKR